jgi:hypothetical protein
MEFLGPVPSEWDETKVLDAHIADYVVMARTNGRDWYGGAMTDWMPRELGIDFSRNARSAKRAVRISGQSSFEIKLKKRSLALCNTPVSKRWAISKYRSANTDFSGPFFNCDFEIM